MQEMVITAFAVGGVLGSYLGLSRRGVVSRHARSEGDVQDTARAPLTKYRTPSTHGTTRRTYGPQGPRSDLVHDRRS